MMEKLVLLCVEIRYNEHKAKFCVDGRKAWKENIGTGLRFVVGTRLAYVLYKEYIRPKSMNQNNFVFNDATPNS